MTLIMTMIKMVKTMIILNQIIYKILFFHVFLQCDNFSKYGLKILNFLFIIMFKILIQLIIQLNLFFIN